MQTKIQFYVMAALFFSCGQELTAKKIDREGRPSTIVKVRNRISFFKSIYIVVENNQHTSVPEHIGVLEHTAKIPFFLDGPNTIYVYTSSKSTTSPEEGDIRYVYIVELTRDGDGHYISLDNDKLIYKCRVNNEKSSTTKGLKREQTIASKRQEFIDGTWQVSARK